VREAFWTFQFAFFIVFNSLLHALCPMLSL
jgi:hypothetical protein